MDLKDELNRLGRSRTNRMIAGICGGFAESTETPAWIWRAGFVFVALWAGTGLLAYLVLWVLMPMRGESA